MGIFGFRFKKEKPLPWPKAAEGGDIVPPALLTTAIYDDMDVEITLNLLRAYGIPTDKRWQRKTHGVDIFVPETMLDEARDLLAAIPEEENV
ncbi:MAG: hypothetical protein LBN99_00720 [Oscillospiraceae bacterium]|jgi:hypothetical protein|nr:hypothetical protein [Oscillospiraceae bacterium]